MFYNTFKDCTNLGCSTTGCSTGTGYIPPSTFRTGMGTYNNMWQNTFYNTKLVTSCPSGTTQYITGYEGSNSSNTWNGKVSCEPVYTITYKDGSTTMTGLTPTTYTESSSTITLPTPTKSGYTFGGWYNNSGLTGTAVTTIPTGSTGNKTYWAKLTANTSGAITLDSKYYASASATSGTAATSAATPTPIYTVYGTGVYSDSAATTAITSITKPTLNGRVFQGFYTTKYSGGTQVINASGTILDAAKTQIATSGGTATWYARWANCGAGYWCSGGNKTACPTGYTSGANATAQSQCYVHCNAGQHVAVRNGLCVSTTATGANPNWYTTAGHNVYYGRLSQVNYCMQGYSTSGDNNADHDNINDCKMTVPAGSVVSSTTMPVRYIKVNSTGSTSNTGSHMVEIQAFEANDGTGTNLLSGKGSSTSLKKATDGSWTRSNYASGKPMTWDLGSTQNVGSIKFAMFTDGRIYHDVVISVSTDNTNWTTVWGTYEMPTDAVSTSVGELIVLSGPVTQCAAGTYKSNSETIYLGQTTTGSCNNCSDLPGVSPTGGTYTSIDDRDADTTCQYTAPDKTIPGCSTVTTNTVTYTGSAWPATTYTVTAANGYSAANNNTASATCNPNVYTVTLDNQSATSAGTTAYYYEYAKHNPCYFYTDSAHTTCLGPNGYTITKPTKTGYTFGGYYTGTNGSGTQYVNASGTCVNNRWNQVGNITLYAYWTPNTSGAITLDSKRYATSSATSGTAATTAAAPSPIYSKYATGMYSDSGATTAITSITTAPALTGYTFAGFYTGKAGTGTKVINADKTFTADAKTRVTTSGGTATWYAHYTTNTNTITLNANGATGGKIRNTAVSSSAQTVTFTCTTGSSMSLPAWNATDSATTTSIVNGTKIFKGWAESSTGNVVSPTTCPSADKTYYAVWESCTACSAGTGCTCSLSVSNNACTYSTAASTGYTLSSGNGTASPSCSATQYTITYKDGSTTLTGLTPASYYVNTDTFSLPSTSKTGYIFNGWYSADNCGGTQTTQIAKGSTGNKTFYACWSSGTYNITYNLNGGNALPSGYTPVEYITSNGSNYFDTTIKFNYGKDARFVGRFSNPNASVRKILIGNYSGSGVVNIELKADGKFRTYFTSSSTVDTASSAAMPANTMVPFDVYYDSMGHFFTSKENGASREGNIPASTVVATNPFRFFLDFRSSPSAIAYPVSIGVTTIYQDGAVVGNFIPVRNSSNVCGMYDTVSSTFYKSATSTAFTCPSVSSMPASYTYGTGATINGTPTRANSVFAGWCTDSALTSCATSQTIATTATGAKTYYAKWTCDAGYSVNSGNTACVANTYTISYAGMDGATHGSSHPTSATYGSAFTVNNPTKSGYTFAGWNVTGMDSANHVYGSTKTTSTSISAITATAFKNLRATSGTVTFTATWTANTITLNWDENSGDAISNGSCTYNSDLVLPPAPTRSGYTFTGWKLANGTVKAASTTVANGCTNTNTGVYSGTSTSIQAQWNKNMTITTPSNHLTYNGSAQTCPGITVSDPSSGATIKYGTASGTYNTTTPHTITNAGETTVYYQVTKSGYTTTTGSYKCYMDKANCTVTLGSTSGSTAYPTTKTVTATTNSGGTLSVSSNATSVATATINNGTVTMTPVKSGSATITVTSAATDNYNACSASYALTVNKGTCNLTINPTSGTITYPTTTTTFTITKGTCNGTITATSSDTAKATVALNDAKTQGTITWKAAGSATITVTAAATDQYNAISKTYSVTIAKGSSTTTVKDGTTTVANATSTEVAVAYPSTKTLTATCSNGATPTVTSATTDVATASISNGTITLTPKKTGSSLITVTCPATSYYNQSTSVFTLTVNNGTITCPDTATGCANKTWTYDTNAHSCSISGVTPNGATVKYGTTNGTYDLTTAPSVTNVSDSKTVYYQITAANYATKTGSFTCNITKATMNASLAGNSKTFNNTALTCDGGTQTGVPSGSTITYSTTNGSGYSATKPTRTDIGTTTVYYKITNPNYNDFTGNFACKVNAGTINITWANGGHGTAPTTPASCTYGSTITMPSAITATGYTFNKWNVNSKTFNAGQTSVACNHDNFGVYSGNVTITASWTTNEYNINYTLNGGDIISSEYTPVEYIQTAGTSYINTGVNVNTTTSRYETKINPTNTSGTNGVFGARNVAGTAGNGSANIFLINGNWRIDWAAGATATVPATADTDYTFSITRGQAVINGTKHTFANNTSVNINYPFFIGIFNEVGKPYSTGFKGKIYYGKIYNNNVLAFNGVPVRRNSDNVCGMYDTITGQFFKSATSTNFTCPSTAVTVTPEPSSYTYGIGTTIAWTPSKTGYTFGGWCTDSGLTSCATTQTISTTATGNKTFYAKWTADSHTITLNANGATGGKIRNTAVSSSAQTVTFTCTTGSSMSLPAWNATDSATTTSIVNGTKIFKGWAESSTGNVVSPTTCPSADKTYYAVWESCTACSAGTGCTCSLSVSNNACTYSTAASTGYTLSSGNGTTSPQCTANCNAITLNANDGTAGSVTTLYKKTAATGWYSNNTCTTAWTSASNIIPTRSGYTFRGFYSADLTDVTSDNSSGTQYITKAGASSSSGTSWTVNAAKTIYAAWAKNCAAGTGANCSLTVSDAGAVDYTTTCKGGYCGTVTNNNAYNPSCPEAASGQWSANANNTCNTCPTGYSGSDSGRDANTDCYYTCPALTVENASSVTAVNTKVYYSGTAYPTCTYNATCSTGYTASGNGTASPSCNVVTYTITYKDASTTLTGLTPTSYNVETTTFNLPTPTKTGYTFAGWYENSGLTGTAVTQIAKGTTGNKTFYAKWSACGNGTYWNNGTCSACPTGYTAGPAVTSQNECKASCSAGQAVLTAGEGCKTVTGNRYQTGTHTVAYNATTPTSADSTSPVAGKLYSCLTNYTISGTTTADHNERSDCKITCNAGTQIASENATSCTVVTGNNYVASNTVAAGSKTTTVNACPTEEGLEITSDMIEQNGITDATGVGTSTMANRVRVKQDHMIPLSAGTYKLTFGNNPSNTIVSRGFYRYTENGKESSAIKVNNNVIISGATLTLTEPAYVRIVFQKSNASTEITPAEVIAAEPVLTKTSAYIISGTTAADHDNINDCKITCAPGTYVSESGGSCVPVNDGHYTAGGTVAYGSTTPSSAIGTCDAGTYAYAGSASCSACPNWTYASTSGAATCTACPTLTSGYSKSDSTGTGWTAYTQCVEIANASPENCATGKLQRIPTADGSTTWSSTTINTALSASAGYYVSGQTCPACSSANNTTSTQTCTIANGAGSQTCNGKYTGGTAGTGGASTRCTGCSSWGTCYVTSCNTGYHKNTTSNATSCVANTDTPYKVNHYTKNLGTTTYTLNSTDNLTGTTGASITLADTKKTITGFTYDAGFVNNSNPATKPTSGAAATTSILADGTTVINLYYTRDTHTVTLTKGTGISAVSGAGTYEYGATVNIDATVSSGYTWSKWTQTSGGTQVSTTKAYSLTMGTSNIAYTANATVNTYTITLDDTTNGGSGGSGTAKEVYNTKWTNASGTTITSVSIPTKTKSVFLGYYNAANGTTQKIPASGALPANTTFTSNTTVYAKFETCTCTTVTGIASCTAKSVSDNKCTYDVTYSNGYYGPATQTNSNAGVASYTATVSSCTNKPSSNSSYTGPATSNACPWQCSTGYSTTGKKAGATTGTGSGKSCTAIDDYAITYTWNGGSCTSPASTYKYGVGATLCTPTRTGYTFTGWTGSNGTTAQTSVTIGTTDTGDKAYTANWTANTYTVTYNSNKPSAASGNVSGTTANSSHTYGTAKALTTNGYSLTGWTFNGWNTAANGSGTSYTNGQSVTNLTSTNGATVTLYAQWTPATYTITYNMNGGTNYSGAPTTYTYGIGATIDGAPTKTGYAFVGWCTDSGLTSCSATQTISTTDTGNKEYWAKWEAYKFSITTTPMAANDTFKFNMSAKGTFYVDCGDGGTLSSTANDIGADGITITRSDTTDAKYTCTYPTAGAHIIRFGGTAEQYSDLSLSPDTNVTKIAAIRFGWINSSEQNDFTPEKIASISGSLGQIFPTLNDISDNYLYQPRFTGTFNSTTNLTSLPVDSNNKSTLFNGINGTGVTEMFQYTFRYAGLTSLPSGLFAGLTGASAMFDKTFQSCTSLTSLPGDLFADISGAHTALFLQTFSNCTSLTSLPESLFDSITGNADRLFANTFAGTGLTSLPADANGNSLLFKHVSGSNQNMFYATFSGTNLTTLPKKLFNISSGTAVQQGMFAFTFRNTPLTSLPDDLFVGLTGSAKEAFYYTFNGCNNLTTIRSDLFAGLSGGAESMFQYTFYNSGLNSIYDVNTNETTSYIPGGFMSNITTSATNLVSYMFTGTGLDKPCPANTYDVTPSHFTNPGKPWCSPCPSGKHYSGTGATSVDQCCAEHYDWDGSQCAGNIFNITYNMNGGETLPSGYTPVEYITGTGSQYIDTNIKADNLTSASGYFSIDSGFVGHVFGSYDSGKYFRMYVPSGSVTQIFGSVSVSPTIYPSDFERNTKIKISMDNTGAVIGSHNYTYSSTPGTFTATSNMRIGAISAYSSNNNYLKGKIYEFTIWRNGEQRFNGIPVKDSNGVCGLYDTVSGTFFKSATSTNFTCPDTAVASLPTTYTYGVGATVTAVPMRDNSVFEGWCTDSALTSCSSTQTISTTTTGDKTFYAKWSCNEGYSSNAAGTACNGNTINITWANGGHGTAPTTPSSCIYGDTITMPVALSAGTCSTSGTFVFNGWSVNNKTLTAGNTTVCNKDNFGSTGGNVTVTGAWTLSCVPITLNPNGGISGSVTTLYKKSNTTGWYSDCACTTAWTSDVNVMPTRSGYTFRGFYNTLANAEDITKNSDSVNGLSRYITHAGATTDQTGKGWLITEPSTLYAGWVKNCNPDACTTCSLSVGQTSTYTTSVKDGCYGISNNGTYNPTASNCPTGYPHSDSGRTVIGNCYATLDPRYYIGTANAAPALCLANGYCIGGSKIYYGNTGGRTACAEGLYSPTGSWKASQCGHILHFGTNANDVVYLSSEQSTTPSLRINWNNQTWYANMVEKETNMSQSSSRQFKSKYNNKTYYVCDDTTCPQ